jgi:hypothetical protein
MIDVNIQPFARNLMTAYIGAIAYKASVNKKNLDMVKREASNQAALRKEADQWATMSFDITSGMIDKRYKESKNFIATGGKTGELRFKRTLSESERHLEFLTRQNMLKARTKYESSVSSYNQKLTDKKLRASMKKIDIRPFI